MGPPETSLPVSYLERAQTEPIHLQGAFFVYVQDAREHMRPRLLGVKGLLLGARNELKKMLQPLANGDTLSTTLPEAPLTFPPIAQVVQLRVHRQLDNDTFLTGLAISVDTFPSVA